MMAATVPQRLDRDTRTWHSAVIAAKIDDERYLLNDGVAARRALSCLIVPEQDDHVLCWVDENGERYIVQLLSRPDSRRVQLDVNGAQELALCAAHLKLHAESQLDLMSLHDLAVQVGVGRLSLMARHVDLTALETMVQNARQYVGRCEHWLQEAQGLARLHGRQTLISAVEDVRADAERISMG